MATVAPTTPATRKAGVGIRIILRVATTEMLAQWEMPALGEDASVAVRRLAPMAMPVPATVAIPIQGVRFQTIAVAATMETAVP